MRRLGPILALLALVLFQFPWVLCTCDDCGSFVPGLTLECACPDHDHGHGHGHHHHHGHSHDEDSEDHEHFATFLSVVQHGAKVELDLPTEAFLAALLVPTADVRDVDTSAAEIDDVPWDDRPVAACPDAGLRLLL